MGMGRAVGFVKRRMREEGEWDFRLARQGRMVRGVSTNWARQICEIEGDSILDSIFARAFSNDHS